MNYWKQVAKQRLLTLDADRKAVENLPEELAQLQIRGPHGSDVRLDVLVKKRELSRRLVSLRRQVEQVCRALGVLSPQERLVLEQLYIYPQRGNLDRLCQSLGCEQATVYRRRDQALRKFTGALYGRNG